MDITLPMRRIENAGRDVVRFRDDVIQQEKWAQGHDALAQDCWVWEDLIAKANFFFDRIMDIDTDVQEHNLRSPLEEISDFEEQIRELMRDWRDSCLQMVPHVDRLETEYGQVDAATKFRENLSEAAGILTDDREFFVGELLIRARNKAVDDHRAGLTEPIFHDEGKS